MCYRTTSRYLFNVAYGVGKQALDRLSADTAFELRDKGVTVISLWPGAVRTELIVKAISDPNSTMGSVSDLIVKNWQKSCHAEELNSRLQRADLFRQGESTEFSGIALAHFAADPKRHEKTGRILLTSELAREYGFADVDGSLLPSTIIHNQIILNHRSKTEPENFLLYYFRSRATEYEGSVHGADLVRLYKPRPVGPVLGPFAVLGCGPLRQQVLNPRLENLKLNKTTARCVHLTSVDNTYRWS